MTESEARSKIKYRLGIARQIAGNGVDGKSFEEFEIALQALKEIREYREIGTVEELKALKEKNEPKKPYLDQKGLLDVKMWHCSVCNKEVISDWNRDLANDYCHHCGQKLDWE